MTDDKTQEAGMSDWTKLPAIEGGHGGCLNCGFQHEVAPMDMVIAVGFGAAWVTKDGKHVYSEDEVQDKEGADYWTTTDAEKLAAADPDHDWRIGLVGPLSERHYQRQGDGHWVLYEKGMGFA